MIRFRRPAHLLLLAVLGWLTFVMLRPYPTGAQAWTLLSSVDLIFHEAGHPLFSIFGISVVAALGGSLMQLVIPIVCLIAFLKERQGAGVAFAMFWVGENLVNIGVYMADAKALLLPLISDGAIHDWNFVFNQWGALDQAVGIGGFVRFAGAFAMLAGCAYAAWTTTRE